MTEEAEIRSQMGKLQRQLDKIEDAKSDAKNAALVGRYFRYRNSYGSGSVWWMYFKVTGYKGGSIRGQQFQTTSDDEVQIEPARSFYRHMHGGFEEIKKSEYERELKKVQRRIAALKA